MKMGVTLTIVITIIVAIVAAILLFVVTEHERSTLIEEVRLKINEKHRVKGTNYSIVATHVSVGSDATIAVYEDESHILTKKMILKELWKINGIKIILMTCEKEFVTIKIYTT